MKKTEKMHIAIIVLGTIFIALSSFHANIWFDEAYTVGIVQKSFSDIWNIGGNDVHPILYYWMLKVVSLIVSAWGVNSLTGQIIAYRIFSVIPMVLLGILGYTHIKKDYGEKVGIVFSFLTFFIPECAIYANEIRMYSWAILFVTILSIYAYRLRKEENSNRKNWLIFFMTSLCSIYIHYYGLMAAGLINIFLLMYLIKNRRKKDIIAILFFGLIQLIAYIPWLIYFITQLSHVSGGFWIGFTFPDTLIQLLGHQLIGKLNSWPSFIVAMAIYMYVIVNLIKIKESKASVFLSIAIYISVIIAALIMTLILNTLILYYRYLFVITGLYIFTLSFVLGKEKNKYISVIIMVVIALLGTINNIKLIKEAYGENNFKQYEYLKQSLQEGDNVVYKESGHGSTIAIFFPEQHQYFYNPENWGVEKAYKAFGENMEIVVNADFTKKLKGRTWIIDTPNKSLYNELFNNEQYNLISEETIWTEYHGYALNMVLVEKISN